MPAPDRPFGDPQVVRDLADRIATGEPPGCCQPQPLAPLLLGGRVPAPLRIPHASVIRPPRPSVTTSFSTSSSWCRVWDPRDPSQELARFDGHSAIVSKVGALKWPGLNHAVVVTGSGDHTARVWDSARSEPGAGPFRRPHWHRARSSGAGVARPRSSGDRHQCHRRHSPGVGFRAIPVKSWPVSTATPAPSGGWRRWSGRALTTRWWSRVATTVQPGCGTPMRGAGN